MAFPFEIVIGLAAVLLIALLRREVWHDAGMRVGAWLRQRSVPLIPALRSGAALELGAVAVIWLAYLMLFLFPYSDEQFGGGGIEYERLAGIILPVREGLRDYGAVPTWNPYMARGTPLLNNGFNYLFNPVTSVPVLLLGGVQGTKVGLALSLLIAGWGAWALARAFGMGGAARVFVGALWMLSGGIAGKLHPGHFQLATSLCWMPLVLAAFWWMMRGADRRAPVVVALTFALMFFAGNIWYTLPTVLCCTAMLIIHLIEPTPTGIRARWDRLQRALLSGAFAAGVAAIQFVPLWFVRESVAHLGAINYNVDPPRLGGQYTLAQAVNNFTVPYPAWDNQYGGMQTIPDGVLLIGVDYAYIGLIPFGLIVAAGVVLAALPRRPQLQGRAALMAFALALLMMTWGAAQTPLLEWLYLNVRLLDEFRYLGRAMAVAALWWIVLAGFAVDVLWSAIREWLGGLDLRSTLRRGMLIGVAIWGLIILYSAQTDEVRLAIMGGSEGLRALFDTLRLMTYYQIALALWGMALVIPALELIGRGVLRRWRLREVAARAAALALLTLLSAALWDAMSANSLTFLFGERFAAYAFLHERARFSDPATPIPNINEPQTQTLMFQNYEDRVRNWGLNEGWIPVPVPGLLARGIGFIGDPEIAQWLITFMPGHPAITPQHRLVAQQCFVVDGALIRIPELTLPCDYTGKLEGTLWVLENAVPYAFIIRSDVLLAEGRQIWGSDVTQVAVESHQIDTITITATMPDDTNFETPYGEPHYYLIVQETHFPGWTATIDGVPALPVTANVYTSVAMQPGTHTYVLRYQPPGLALGLLISLGTAVAIALYLARPRLSVEANTILRQETTG